LTFAFADPTASSLYGSFSYLFISGDSIDLEAINAVPEPGTWAMMLGGLVVLLGIQYRRGNGIVQASR